MSGVQETRLDGSPASLYELAAWLKNDFAAAAGRFADDVYAGRSAAGSAWEGAAADQLHRRLGEVGKGADALNAEINVAARAVEALADALRDACDLLCEARRAAVDGGLRVEGTRVFRPAAEAATTTEEATYHAHVATWNGVVKQADEGYRTWSDGIDAFGAAWEQNRPNIATAVIGLFQGAVGGVSVFNKVYRFTSVHRIAFDAARNHLAVDLRALDDIVKDGHLKPTATADRFYRLQKNIGDARAAITELHKEQANDLRRVRPGKAVSRTFTALGVVATGYGVYQDIQDGESTAQAVTSNVVGLAAGAGTAFAFSSAAGLASAALAGAACGSVVPVAGTVVGAVVGAGVGIFASGMVDHWFEEGREGVVGALAAGGREIADTTSAIGDAVGDAASAVGGGLHKVWGAIF